MERDLALDNQLCFALYSAARAASGAYRSALSELGLTYTQFVTMLALWEEDGITVTALGRRLHLDSGTLSPLLKRLADLGYLERRRGVDDERRVTIHLTDTGRNLRSQVSGVQRCLHDSLDMTDDEVETLRSLSQRFCEAVERAAETPPPCRA
ncbi:hypothetical protein KEM60_01273 [Austwickia sp. TVS 96-490-7B]|uniref:MarR family winged helix-turn-helix transcriptional regulator n=1 Tax=Austwickia sp. TVS 96-490-7B TaxID=2830843 RepID=UPI001C56D40E|nr:MarR family transcriptional regulator [Austwickia sp. TVS 96-490-7B]MBW3085081.1 hypothetical protein [Austwickia sp. TVS 96-490-7B]